MMQPGWRGSAVIPGLLQIPRLKRRLLPNGSVEMTMVGLSSFVDPAPIAIVYREFSLEQALVPRIDIWRATRDASLLERQLTYEQRTYLVELLRRQDKMCMAHGIENRVPMLDHRVVEPAKRMPTQLKVGVPLLPCRGHGEYYTKSILKQMASRIYGQPFAYRINRFLRCCCMSFRQPGVYGGVPGVPECPQRSQRIRSLCDRRALSGGAQDRRGAPDSVTLECDRARRLAIGISKGGT
jgi:hypothetical protein